MDRDILLSIQSELCRVNDNLEEIKDAVNELQGEERYNTKEILLNGCKTMAKNEARMKDEVALETYKQATSGYVETVGTPILESTTTCNTRVLTPEEVAKREEKPEEDIVKEVTEFLHKNYPYTQAFNTRNIAGDDMETVYDKNGITVDYCANWNYIEVFGLTTDEFRDVMDKRKVEEKPEEFTTDELETLKDIVLFATTKTDYLDGCACWYQLEHSRLLDKLSKMIQEYE